MLYEVTVMQSYFGKSPINRFNYVLSGVPAAVLGSFALTTAMGFLIDGARPAFENATLAGQWKAAVAAALTFRGVICKAVYDVADFYEATFVPPVAGGQAGEAMSPTAALGFRSNRVRTDIDRGYKRFAGLSEGSVDAGGFLSAAFAGGMVNLAGELGETLTYDDEGNTLTFVPCVVSKVEYATPSGKRAYKYYPTLATQMDHVAQGVDWQVYQTQRTQRSRQY